MNAGDWVWVWLGAAVFFGFGELFTPFLFFSLSFAVGAGAAALAGGVGTSFGVQLIVFLAVTTAALVALVPIGHRLARADPVDDAAEGATRYVGRVAVVLESIPSDPHATGVVRLESAKWRAETDDDVEIPAGSHVDVLAVRGTRLVVAPEAHSELSSGESG